jgi:hypothetical protein
VTAPQVHFFKKYAKANQMEISVCPEKTASSLTVDQRSERDVITCESHIQSVHQQISQS